MILFCRGFQTPTNYEVVRRQVVGRVIVIPIEVEESLTVAFCFAGSSANDKRCLDCARHDKRHEK